MRRNYLRALGDDVDAALALIVHDIVATGALPTGEAGPFVRIRASQYRESQAPNGVNPRADDTALWVAEAAQEDLMEGVGTTSPLGTWPPCPDHPNHPLWLRSKNEHLDVGNSRVPDDPVWTCIATGRAVAELGQL